MLTHTDKNECICNHIEFIEHTEEKTNDIILYRIDYRNAYKSGLLFYGIYYLEGKGVEMNCCGDCANFRPIEDMVGSCGNDYCYCTDDACNSFSREDCLGYEEMFCEARDCGECEYNKGDDLC